MIAGFFYDAKQDYYKGNFYGQAINAQLWKRYLKYFDRIMVCVRYKNTTESNGNLSSNDNVDFDCIKCTGNIIKDYLKLKQFSAKEHIKKCLTNVDFAIIRLPSEIGLIAVKYCKKLNKPYLIELVGCPWDSNWNHGLLGKLLAPSMTLRTKHAVKNAKHVIYVSNEFLQSRYPTNGNAYACSDVICSYIDENLTKRLEKIESKHDYIVAGTAGGINVRFKGQQYVIRAMARLKKEGINNIKYFLAGGGNEEYLSNIATKYGVADDVKFLGSLTQNEMQKFYQYIDVYIQPSKQEGLCRSLIEASSFACPCIASNAGGNGELISEDYVYRNDNKIVNHIVDMFRKITDKNELIRLAKINHAMSNQYDENVLMEKSNKIYKEILRDYNI